MRIGILLLNLYLLSLFVFIGILIPLRKRTKSLKHSSLFLICDLSVIFIEYHSWSLNNKFVFKFTKIFFNISGFKVSLEISNCFFKLKKV